MHAPFFLATLLPVVGVLAGDVTPLLGAHRGLLASYPGSPLLYRGITERQAGGRCSSSQKACGNFCIPSTDTCCPDLQGGCPTADYYCDQVSSGVYGCCARGKTCGGPPSDCTDGSKLCGAVCIPNEYTCCPDQLGGCAQDEYCYQATPNSRYRCCLNGEMCTGSTGGGGGVIVSSVQPAPSPSTVAAPATSSPSSSLTRPSPSSTRPSPSTSTPDEEPDQTDVPDVPDSSSSSISSSTSTTRSSTRISPNSSPTPNTGATATAGVAGSPSSTLVAANSGGRSSATSLLWAVGVIVVGMVML